MRLPSREGRSSNAAFGPQVPRIEISANAGQYLLGRLRMIPRRRTRSQYFHHLVTYDNQQIIRLKCNRRIERRRRSMDHELCGYVAAGLSAGAAPGESHICRSFTGADRFSTSRNISMICLCALGFGALHMTTAYVRADSSNSEVNLA